MAYTNKVSLLTEIDKTASLFISEFSQNDACNNDTLIEGSDKAPVQMIAYPLGWLYLVRQWDEDELAGKTVFMPKQGYNWNQLG